MSRRDVALRRARQQASWARHRWRAAVWGGRLLLLVVILGIWQFAPESWLDPDSFSRPLQVSQAWIAMASSGALWADTQVTIGEFLVGYVCGAAIAVLCACLLTLDRLAYRVSEPLLIALYGIPMVSLGPLLVIWFGTGTLSKIALAAQGTFTLVLVNTVAGILAADPRTTDILRGFGANRAGVYRRFILPQSLPYLVSSLKLAIATAMVGVVLGEFLGSRAGIGHAIQDEASTLATDRMIAHIATLAASVFVLRLMLVPAEKWIERQNPRQGAMQ